MWLPVWDGLDLKTKKSWIFFFLSCAARIITIVAVFARTKNPGNYVEKMQRKTKQRLPAICRQLQKFAARIG